MKNIKPHFVLKAQERNGVFLLIIIIFLLQLIYYFWGFWQTKEGQFFQNEKEASIIQQQIDSLKKEKINDKIERIFPFNPNFITDYKGYTLGMSIQEIDRLLEYRKAGNWINSPQEFQEVTGVSDSLLSVITPNFKFPDFVRKAETGFSKTKKSSSTNLFKKDLNTATETDLQKIDGIGEVLSKRIVRYGDKIGGYIDNQQLKDIYGLKYDLIEKISEQYVAQPSEGFRKMNINEVTVLQLSELPYFNYELAREVINYKLINEKIRSFEELTKIEGFPAEKIGRIKLYLTLN